MIEVEGQRIDVMPYSLVCQISNMLRWQIQVGQPRRQTGTWFAIVVPPDPLRFSSWDVGIGVKHDTCRVSGGAHQPPDCIDLPRRQAIWIAVVRVAGDHFRLPHAGCRVGYKFLIHAGLSTAML